MFHDARVDARNSAEREQCKPVQLNTFDSTTLNHIRTLQLLEYQN